MNVFILHCCDTHWFLAGVITTIVPLFLRPSSLFELPSLIWGLFHPPKYALLVRTKILPEARVFQVYILNIFWSLDVLLFLLFHPVFSMTTNNVISITVTVVVRMVARRIETPWTSRHTFMIHRHQV